MLMLLSIMLLLILFGFMDSDNKLEELRLIIHKRDNTITKYRGLMEYSLIEISDLKQEIERLKGKDE